MWRTGIIIAVLLTLLIFAALNMHQTRVNVPFTQGYEIRTVFLLIVSFALGYAVAYFVELTRHKRE
ncbi:unnamed protein product [marine sediment metagenome]|uniref:Lipopolysaccharide assembly protein A domain-containing protein n=1 Tax=marine sediment metagenome TaxID=412755 RepID=X0VNX5_9ZZZZ